MGADNRPAPAGEVWGVVLPDDPGLAHRRELAGYQRCRDWVAQIGEALGLPPDTDPDVGDTELFLSVLAAARRSRAEG